jgi:purine nucleosidase/pyrimidine-specific ribonucleoside hydrolase
MTLPTPIILDCDPGHDDAMAILLAAANPAVELLGITTVSGNGSLEKVTYNALRMCAVANIVVPIAKGANDPLAGKASAAPTIHGATALDGAELPEPTFEISQLSAVELIAKLVSECDRKVTLIPTGPLTNIAMFLQAHPELHDRIEHISFMGGSTERGNWTPYAEFNIWADPEAADIVMRSGLPLIMSGLNITHQALATPEILDRISALDTKLARTVVDLLQFFATTYREVFGMPDPPVHDPVALAIVIDASVARLVSAPVAIELHGELTRGATAVDLYGTTGQAANVDVAMELDVEKFWNMMIDALKVLGKE